MVQSLVAQQLRLQIIAYTLFCRDEGQDMVEYGLLAALIALIAIVLLRALGPYLDNTFQDVANAVAGR